MRQSGGDQGWVVLPKILGGSAPVQGVMSTEGVVDSLPSEKSLVEGRGVKLVGIAAVEEDVSVDEAREDELAGCVDVAVGGGKEIFGADGGDLLAGDGYGSVENVGRGYDFTAGDYGVYASIWYRAPPG